MRYIFGPVISRRLGVSLGIDVVPYKTCTFDCIYCECGRTTLKTIKRKPYIKARDIINELREYLTTAPGLDYITLTGSGEPLLNSGIRLIIKEIKRMTQIPVAVLTNGSLLYVSEVRKDLLSADLVIPSLDAVCKTSFLKIDRPRHGLDLVRIIKGLILFRKEFKGLIWLEIFFVKDMNDQQTQIKEIINIIKKIKPDRVQLNTVDRPPAEKFAHPLSNGEMQDICKRFIENGIPTEVIKPGKKKINIRPRLINKNAKEQITDIIKRRPETARNLASILGLNINIITRILQDMEERKTAKKTFSNNSGKPYWSIMP